MNGRTDAMQGGYLGPDFSREQIGEFLEARGIPHEEIPDEAWADRIAKLIAAEKVVGLF